MRNRVGLVGLVVQVGASLLTAVAVDAQTRPAVLTSITPYGLQQGTTVSFKVDGANIAGADRVIFDDPGLSASIGAYSDLGADVRERMPGETGAIIQDKAEKAALTLSITASAGVLPGRHGFRLHTPLGTTSFMPLWVGAEPELIEQEPNDDPARAMALPAPVTVNGWLEREGDVDFYRVDGRAGQDLVVRVTASPIGSEMDPTVALLAPDGHELATNDDFGGNRDSLLIYRPSVDGPLLVRIKGANAAGGWRNIYRATIGDVPVLTGVFPLGRPKVAPTPVRVEGANLDETLECIRSGPNGNTALTGRR